MVMLDALCTQPRGSISLVAAKLHVTCGAGLGYVTPHCGPRQNRLGGALSSNHWMPMLSPPQNAEGLNKPCYFFCSISQSPKVKRAYPRILQYTQQETTKQIKATISQNQSVPCQPKSPLQASLRPQKKKKKNLPFPDSIANCLFRPSSRV